MYFLHKNLLPVLKLHYYQVLQNISLFDVDEVAGKHCPDWYNTAETIERRFGIQIAIMTKSFTEKRFWILDWIHS